MTTEDYVSYETAKLLKEKGFDAPCLSYFWTEENGANISYCETPFTNQQLYSGQTLRPTLQMAMKWLREKHNKIIIIGISLDDRTSSTINHYNVGIWYIPKNNGGAFCYTSPTPYNGYPSFEEACESAIKYCLEKLI